MIRCDTILYDTIQYKRQGLRPALSYMTQAQQPLQASKPHRKQRLETSSLQTAASVIIGEVGEDQLTGGGDDAPENVQRSREDRVILIIVREDSQGGQVIRECDLLHVCPLFDLPDGFFSLFRSDRFGNSVLACHLKISFLTSIRRWIYWNCPVSSARSVRICESIVSSGHIALKQLAKHIVPRKRPLINRINYRLFAKSRQGGVLLLKGHSIPRRIRHTYSGP